MANIGVIKFNRKKWTIEQGKDNDIFGISILLKNEQKLDEMKPKDHAKSNPIMIKDGMTICLRGMLFDCKVSQ